jgi:hypothetical protein
MDGLLQLTLPDIIGLCGVGLTLGSYARLQWRRDFAKSITYSAFNLLAAVLFCISLMEKWNLASFTCNVLWGVISLYGVYRCLKYEWKTRQLKTPG